MGAGLNVSGVAVGAVLVVAARQGLVWYDVDPGRNVAGTGFGFDDLHANADALDAAVSQAFFGWLAAVVLVLGALAAVLANVPSPATNGLRLAAFTCGLVGVVGTVYAVAQLFDAQRAAGGSDNGITHNATFGFWTCLIGFALIGLGGALAKAPGPRADPV